MHARDKFGTTRRRGGDVFEVAVFEESDGDIRTEETRWAALTRRHDGSVGPQTVLGRPGLGFQGRNRALAGTVLPLPSCSVDWESACVRTHMCADECRIACVPRCAGLAALPGQLAGRTCMHTHARMTHACMHAGVRRES